VLHVAELTKRYGHLAALSEVSFSIRPGEVLGLIGPNGSGKTTLFECLGGVLPADGGGVYEGDRVIAPSDRWSVLFYMPDGIAPWPAQTVAWALEFARGFFSARSRFFRAHDPAAKNRELTSLVDQLDLGPLLGQRIGELSKGQRKRVLLAIGLLTPQRVLLADEPFDGLDLRQTREVAQTLKAHAAAGRTLFLSVHQISDAARVCDRFVLLSGGRVRGEGTPTELSALAAARGANRSQDLEEVFLALT
jgi:ABC-type multidrug transport system ATPase subunit